MKLIFYYQTGMPSITLIIKITLNKLGGGEATRVAMAEMFIKASNVLILDEPTNFIDVFTIEALESFIQKYSGTVIFTSHDKEFVSRVADQVYQIDEEKLIHLR